MNDSSSILVIDLEATCADDGSLPPNSMEIIEIGAVWATPDGEILNTFERLVRPTEHPQLTRFCRGLTTIEQTAIDGAATWPIVAGELAEFVRFRKGTYWGSWGSWDQRQIDLDCARHNIANPLIDLEHCNLKAAFAKTRKIKQVGMTTALLIAGLEQEGQHHRALADARNIARMLPKIKKNSQDVALLANKFLFPACFDLRDDK